MRSGTITTTMLNLRATPDERGTIQRAAQLTHQTVSDFVRAAVLERAALIEQVLREKRI